MVISNANARKVTVEGKFPSAIAEWVHFTGCWVHMRCNGIRGKLTIVSLHVRHVQISKQTEEDCPGIELKGQSFETVEKFFILYMQ